MRKADLHCDTISLLLEKQEKLYSNSGHFDILRARQAGLAIQVFALFCKPDGTDRVLRQILKQIDIYYREVENNQNELYNILEFSDIVTAQSGQIGCLLHLEGAEALGRDIELVHIFHQLGLRSMGLTWNYRNMMADGVGEGIDAGGLSKWGRLLIREMQSLNIILDLAHLAERGFYEALEIYERPLMVSHANARALCGHWRNLSDEQLKALKANDSLVGVTAVSDFVRSDGQANVEDLVDHMVYIADLIGTRHIALGSDFDGADDMVMTGIGDYRQWEEILPGRGFTALETEDILYNNVLRLFKTVL